MDRVKAWVPIDGIVFNPFYSACIAGTDEYRNIPVLCRQGLMCVMRLINRNGTFYLSH